MSSNTELVRGWHVILGSLLGIGFGVTGLFFYSAGAFLKPLAHEFGWSRAAASSVTLVAALALAATAPFVGRIVDRIGAQTVAFGSSVGLAMGFYLLSHSSGSLSVYLLLVLVTILLGAGASPVAYTRLLNLWFDTARGTALGLAQTATGIAAGLIPLLLLPYMAAHGWRSAYQALSLATLVSTPLVYLLLGRRAPPVGGTATSTLPMHALTLGYAVPSAAFVTLLGMLVCAAIGVSGLIVHLVPMLTDAGLSTVRVVGITSLLGLGIVVGRALTGVLVDRVFAPRIAFCAFLAAASGCLLLSFRGPTWAAPAAVLTGFAMGAEVDFVGYFVARYFGMAHYGSIYGWLYAAFMVGTAIGPLVVGAAFDHFGDYHLASLFLGIALAAAAGLSWLLPPFAERA